MVFNIWEWYSAKRWVPSRDAQRYFNLVECETLEHISDLIQNVISRQYYINGKNNFLLEKWSDFWQTGFSFADMVLSQCCMWVGSAYNFWCAIIACGVQHSMINQWGLKRYEVSRHTFPTGHRSCHLHDIAGTSSQRRSDSSNKHHTDPLDPAAGICN